jgi:CRISPR/Cas system Type II protein with McrA/HNH and RuvC-like nuclease domain
LPTTPAAEGATGLPSPWGIGEMRYGMAKFGYSDVHWDAYIRDKCRCVYCGLDGTKFENWRQLTLDHIIPEAKGGEDVLENLAVCCRRCNDNKGTFNPVEGIESNPKPSRELLIRRAKEEVKKKIAEERSAFEAMMEEIKGK